MDQLALQHLGVELGAVSILLLTGQMTVMYQQVIIPCIFAKLSLQQYTVGSMHLPVWKHSQLCDLTTTIPALHAHSLASQGLAKVCHPGEICVPGVCCGHLSIV